MVKMLVHMYGMVQVWGENYHGVVEKKRKEKNI